MQSEVDVRDTSPEMEKFLAEALAEEQDGRSEKAAPRSGARSPSAPVVGDTNSRLPRRIEGGFTGLGQDLDKYGRECRNAVRLMEQLRLQLEAAEAERVRLHQLLVRILPEIDENARGLVSMMESARKGDVNGDLSAKFASNAAKLDELEKISEALNINLMAVRSAWEQYARAAIQAQRLREAHRGH